MRLVSRPLGFSKPNCFPLHVVNYGSRGVRETHVWQATHPTSDLEDLRGFPEFGDLPELPDWLCQEWIGKLDHLVQS